MNRHGIFCLSAAAAFLAALNAVALGPHEVLLLVNTNSQCSIEVAAAYARLRSVPGINVVKLGIPMEQGCAPVGISAEDFTRRIWLPANEAVKDRGIGDHILVWVYSVDFPTRVTMNPQVSINGMTFMRNKPVESTLISKGSWRSPLFTSPNNPGGGGVSPSQSFDVSRAWLGEDMPLPSMMLGYAGDRGNSKEAILNCIESGVKSDRTRPTGTVYFVTGGDIRSKAREWQFPVAQQKLLTMGVASVITNNLPSGRTNILGMIVGLADLVPRQFGRFLPGSIADHLTSFAGDFQTSAQTKLSAWIEAGATVSAGTVVEPLALWTKFPCAWVYVHYATGCTAIESLYQGVSCPLQLLFVGEPLACPWAPVASVTLAGLEAATVSGIVSVKANVASRGDRAFPRCVFLLDGRTIPGALGIKATQAGNGNAIEIDTSSLSGGPHVLRAVAYSTGSVHLQVFTEKTFVVKNGKR